MWSVTLVYPPTLIRRIVDDTDRDVVGMLKIGTTRYIVWWRYLFLSAPAPRARVFESL